jgi:hypothetical protein
MSTYVKRKVYPLPPVGPCRAKLIEVEDLGEVPSGNYPPKPQLKMSWLTQHRDPETGQGLVVWDRVLATLNSSKNGPSKLAKRACSLLNVSKAPLELEVRSLIGRTCQLVLVHVQKEDGRTFCNIEASYPDSPSAPTTVLPPLQAVSPPVANTEFPPAPPSRNATPPAPAGTGDDLAFPPEPEPPKTTGADRIRAVMSADSKSTEIRAGLKQARAKLKGSFTTPGSSTESATA